MIRVNSFYNFYYPHCDTGITGVRTLGRLDIEELWQGVDVTYIGTDEGYITRFTVAPEWSANAIQWQFDGVDSARIGMFGELQLYTPLGAFFMPPPIAYSGEDTLPASYMRNGGTFGVAQLGWSGMQPLHIEWGGARGGGAIGPDWVTYLGGAGNDRNTDVVSAGGDAYVVGFSTTNELLAQLGAPSIAHAGGNDAIIYKFDQNGAPKFVTFLGGSANDRGFAIDAHPSGLVAITGVTESGNLPMEPANNSSYSGAGDAYLAIFNSLNGQKVFIGYLGGEGIDIGKGVAFSGSDVVIVGETTSDDLTPVNLGGAYNQNFIAGMNDGFIAQYDAAYNINWTTYFGGEDRDNFSDVVAAGDGRLYLTGSTRTNHLASSVTGHTPCTVPSTTNGGFPDCTPSGAYTQTHNQSGVSNFHDAIVVEFDADRSLLWSTYFGGNSHERSEYITSTGTILTGELERHALAIHPEDDDIIAITGSTQNTWGNNNFPFPGANPPWYFQSTSGWNFYRAFVARFENRSHRWGTIFGGEPSGPSFGDATIETSVAFDDQGNVWIAGRTNCGGIPPSGEHCDVPSDADDFPICEHPFFFFQKDANGDPVFQGTEAITNGDGYVAAFSPAHQLIISTWFGGTNTDQMNAMAYDATLDRIYLTGTTVSVAKFPLIDPQTGNYQQDIHAGNLDGFLARLSIDEVTVINEPFVDHSQLLVVPNPAHDAIHVVGWDSKAPIRVLDPRGRQVLSASAPAFSVAALEPGLYFIVVDSEAGMRCAKFVKL